MANGKTRLQKAMVLKSGKLKFIKNTTKKKSSSKRKATTKRTAKKKSTKRRAKTRSVRQSASKKSRGRNMAKGNQLTKKALAGAGYGFVREPINQLAKNIPVVGNLADEVALGALGFMADKYGKGMIKQLGKAMIVVESYNLGRNFGAGSMNLFGASNTNTSSSQSGATF